MKSKLNSNLKLLLSSAVLVALATHPIRAVRPFITDDGAIIGYKRSELASWTFVTNSSAEFWHSANFGVHERLELTVAAFWGYSKSEDDVRREFSYTIPLVQAKYLFRDYEPNGLPGLTIAAGSDLPFGKGAFVAGGYGAFIFGSATQCLGEDENVLIHLNAGGTYLRENQENLKGFTWGIGTQIKTYKGLHIVAEIVSGDPYIHNAGFAYQLGLRHFVSDFLQFDVAFGKGVSGNNRMPSWVSGGVRYVLPFGKPDENSTFAPNGRKVPIPSRITDILA
jgi:hypothetical protein